MENVKGDSKRKMAILGLSMVTVYCDWAAIFYTLFSSIGIIVSGIVILGFYNGKKAERNQRFNKWFFYIYYPVHFIVLLLVKALC